MDTANTRIRHGQSEFPAVGKALGRPHRSGPAGALQANLNALDQTALGRDTLATPKG